MLLAVIKQTEKEGTRIIMTQTNLKKAKSLAGEVTQSM